MEGLTDKEYWDNEYTPGKKLSGIKQKIRNILFKRNRIIMFLCRHIKANNAKSVLEIGCYPANYLEMVAKMGYEVSGIDIASKTSELLPRFESKGYKIGEFIEADVFSHKYDKTFDCVYSLGFIEHFLDFENVLLRHTDLVSQNGLVIITAPNLKNNRWLWMNNKYRPTWRESHNIEAINLEKWKEVLTGAGFDIKFCGYFGEFYAYNGMHLKKSSKLKRYLLKLFRVFSLLMPTWLDCKSEKYASFLGIVAKKMN